MPRQRLIPRRWRIGWPLATWNPEAQPYIHDIHPKVELLVYTTPSVMHVYRYIDISNHLPRAVSTQGLLKSGHTHHGLFKAFKSAHGCRRSSRRRLPIITVSFKSTPPTPSAASSISQMSARGLNTGSKTPQSQPSRTGRLCFCLQRSSRPESQLCKCRPGRTCRWRAARPNWHCFRLVVDRTTGYPSQYETKQHKYA